MVTEDETETSRLGGDTLHPSFSDPFDVGLFHPRAVEFGIAKGVLRRGEGGSIPLPGSLDRFPP